MLWLFRLALKNLFRNLRRTLLSMGSVIAGVGILILGQGFIGGIEENIIRAEVDSLSGHVLIRPADYPDAGLNHPIDALVTVPDDLAAALDSETVAWTKRLIFVPRAIAGLDSLRVRAIAFDPTTDAAVFPRDTWKHSGAIPTSARDGVLVSRGLAELLQIGAGDTLTFTVRTSAGAINALTVPVSGVLTTGNPVIDSFGVVMTADLGQELARNGEGYSHIAARVRNRNQAFALSDTLTPLLPEGAEITDWEAETHDLIELQKIRRRALNILVFALMGMSAAGIANTILMAAYERIREVGTLRAMGMTRGGVVNLFVIEGLVLGMVGATIGALGGGGIAAYYSAVGIDLTPLIEDGGAGGGNIPISAMLYVEFSPFWVTIAVTFGLLVATLASIYPAWVASSMEPADAVRAN